MNIATSATRMQYPLSAKKIIKKTIAGTIGWIVALFIFGAIVAYVANQDQNRSNYVGTMAWVFFVLVVVFIIAAYLYERWYFATYFYELDADHIVIRKGPITPREITIPYERVQDVYVDQDILDRMFGLYDVHLSSATYASGMEAHIDGVEKSAADGLRKQILDTVTARISKKPQQ